METPRSEILDPGTVDGEDLISTLPDCLLQHILSFLKLHQAIATSILSRRWRSLWTSIPALNLYYWFCNHLDIVTSINMSLMLYDAPKIQKFCVHFNCADLKQHQLDSWIRFATKRNVNEFILNLSDDEDRDLHELEYCHTTYVMIGCLFECRSLEILLLKYCVLNLYSPLSLRLLRKLELHHVRISDLNTSGCPLLETIVLRDCNSDRVLNVHAPSQKLVYLGLEDMVEVTWRENADVMIFAPHLVSLQIVGSIRRTYDFKNLASLRRVTLQFNDIFDGRIQSYDDRFHDVCSLMEILQYVRHASTITLCLWCIQAISEATGMNLPLFRTTCLELTNTLDAPDLLAMASVLRSCHYLESFILFMDFPSEELWPFRLDKDWEMLEHSLYNTNHQLKFVQIHNFLPSKEFWFFDDPKTDFNIDEFLGKCEKIFKLVELLLASCPVLEKMTIRTLPIRNSSMELEVLRGLTDKLLAFPRASPNAVIHIIPHKIRPCFPRNFSIMKNWILFKSNCYKICANGCCGWPRKE